MSRPLSSPFLPSQVENLVCFSRCMVLFAIDLFWQEPSEALRHKQGHIGRRKQETMTDARVALVLAAPVDKEQVTVVTDVKTNNFRKRRPPPIRTTVNEAIPESPEAPMNEQGRNPPFFPSPRSILERRSSTGSFFEKS